MKTIGWTVLLSLVPGLLTVPAALAWSAPGAAGVSASVRLAAAGDGASAPRAGEHSPDAGRPLPSQDTTAPPLTPAAGYPRPPVRARSNAVQPASADGTSRPDREVTAARAASRYALPPPAPSQPETRDSSAHHSTGKAPILTTFGALAVAIGLFLLVAWLCRRRMPAGSRALPPDVVELLGRTPLADRQYAYLLRVGNKLLLVAISSAGADTLTEITDPGEVDRLAGLCNQSHANSATTAFRQALQQFSREQPAAGSVDGGRQPSVTSTYGRQPVREPTHA